jgi:hypothetical protein
MAILSPGDAMPVKEARPLWSTPTLENEGAAPETRPVTRSWADATGAPEVPGTALVSPGTRDSVVLASASIADRGPAVLRVNPKIAPVIRNNSASMTMTRAMTAKYS